MSPWILAVVVGGFLLVTVRVDLSDLFTRARELAGGVKHGTCARVMGMSSQQLTRCLEAELSPTSRPLAIQRLAALTTDPDGKKVFAFFCYLLAKQLNADEVLESAAMVGRTLDQLQVTMAKAELRDKERKVS